MSKIAALLANDEIAETVTDSLARMRNEDITWELFQEEDEMERLLPAFGWPGGTTGQTGGTVGVPLGVAVETSYPENQALEDRGADDDVADFYAQSIAHGATAIVVETPHEYREQVRSALADAGATRIAWE